MKDYIQYLPKDFELIKQQYIEALESRSAQFPYMATKSEWVVPTPSVGDVVNVLFCYDPKRPDALFSDLDCGDTTVVEIKRTGSVVLANGYSFHKNGYGHARNNNCVIASNSVGPWNMMNRPKSERASLLKALKHLPYNRYRENKQTS